MIAKTQSKVDQFLAKRQLRKQLKLRSLLKPDDKHYKETRAELDNKIEAIRDFLQVNQAMLPERKAVRRGKALVAV